MSGERTLDLFDRWADTYDDLIAMHSDKFPFAGYNALLNRIVELTNPKAGMKILDVGIGIGELAKRFIEYDCEIWGLDYSPKMLDITKKKIPEAHLIKGNVRSEWNKKSGIRFDRIVSAYTLHHFNLEGRIAIIRDMFNNGLASGGLLAIGDVSFHSLEELNRVRKKMPEEWDDTEYYWSADSVKSAVTEDKFNILYEQISFCGGAYLISPRAEK